ncbi:hypothetical protein Peur_065091 [Populus x canadensis]
MPRDCHALILSHSCSLAPTTAATFEKTIAVYQEIWQRYILIIQNYYYYYFIVTHFSLLVCKLKLPSFFVITNKLVNIVIWLL